MILPLSASSPEARRRTGEPIRVGPRRRGTTRRPVPYGGHASRPPRPSVGCGRPLARRGVRGPRRLPPGRAPPGLFAGRAGSASDRASVFLFAGEGSQWCGMGQRLYEEEPVFRDALATCDRAMRPHLEDSLLTELLAPQSDSRVDDDVEIAAPAVFAIQVALQRALAIVGNRAHGRDRPRPR